MTGNIFEQIPNDIPEEFIERIFTHPHVSIERIVSRGHSSPPGFWYNQEKHEWVILLKGAASIRFEEGNRLVTLTEGSYLNIPAHTKHRVEWTQADAESIWLAVYY